VAGQASRRQHTADGHGQRDEEADRERRPRRPVASVAERDEHADQTGAQRHAEHVGELQRGAGPALLPRRRGAEHGHRDGRVRQSHAEAADRPGEHDDAHGHRPEAHDHQRDASGDDRQAPPDQPARAVPHDQALLHPRTRGPRQGGAGERQAGHPGVGVVRVGDGQRHEGVGAEEGEGQDAPGRHRGR
jgi:hypothetical protein